MKLDIRFAIEKLPLISRYIGNTIYLSVLAMIFGFALAVIIVLLRYYKVKGVQRVLQFFVDFFRGTPLVAQLFFLYYGLAALFPIFTRMSGFAAAVIGMSLNGAAYMSENLRAALMAVDSTQTEAGLACGMKELQVMRYIILPQAARIAVPTITNDFINLVKGSSMAFVLGVRELMAQTSIVGAVSYKYFECYMDVVIIYFLLNKVIHLGERALEGYLDKKR